MLMVMDKKCGDNWTKSNYNCIDILKLFFCLCIIIMHTNGFSFLPNSIEYMLEKCVVRLAVPYFFMASGFFLMKKIENPSNYLEYGGVLIQYSKRLLKPYIFFESINCVQQAVTLLIEEKLSVGETFIQILQHLLFNPYGALWYVWAVIWTCAILMPFLKRKKLDTAIACGAVLYLVGLLASRYYFVACGIGIKSYVDMYRYVFMTNRNAIFVGLLFVSLGIKCYDLHKQFRISKKVIGVGVLLYVLFSAEVVATHVIGNYVDDGAYYIFLVPVVFLVFLISTKIKYEDKPIFREMRRYSVGMYFLHIPIRWCISHLTDNNQILCIAVIFVSGMICMGVFKSKDKFLNSVLS